MLRFADVVNAQQIMQWQWACDVRQISGRSTIQITHFPFPPVKDLRLPAVAITLVL